MVHQSHSVELSIIIPCYNEQSSIETTLEELISEPRLQMAEIIVIDDGSRDRTGEIASQYSRVRLIAHRTNQGYGAAISTGIRYSGGTYIIWYDADGQHRREDLLRVFDQLVKGNLDYCIGVRDARSHRVKERQFGKWILRVVVNLVAGVQVADFNSGLRGFRRSVIIRYLHLLPKGFSASTTTTLLMLERGYTGAEVDIIAKARIGQSTVKQVRDGFRTIMVIMRIVLLFKPLYFFGTVSAVTITLGTFYGFVEAVSLRQGFPVFGALLIILGVQSLFFGLLSDQISLQRRERFERYE